MHLSTIVDKNLFFIYEDLICQNTGLRIGKTRPIAISRVLREQRPTDRPTDKAAYRVACTRLKRGERTRRPPHPRTEAVGEVQRSHHRFGGEENIF